MGSYFGDANQPLDTLHVKGFFFWHALVVEIWSIYVGSLSELHICNQRGALSHLLGWVIYLTDKKKKFLEVLLPGTIYLSSPLYIIQTIPELILWIQTLHWHLPVMMLDLTGLVTGFDVTYLHIIKKRRKGNDCLNLS